ncbi:diguanylate cyclase [Vibrio cholerae]|nr:diguanylate cyclase [Vibrio cholerae]EKF9404830.1 diguanylate cyclase [Vibrio cholerae]
MLKLHFDTDRLEVLKSCLLDAKISYMEMLPIFYSIVSESQNSVVLTNSNREIIYVNEAFESLSGYRLVEVLGKSPSILKSKKTPLTVYQELNHTLKKGEVWKGVFTNLHKNGDEYIEEAVITPIVSNEGLILFYFAEKKDITSLVNAESIVRKLTHFDSLTDLPNRNHFIEYASGLVSREHNNENYFTAIFCDLNRFKELNDNLGHQAGDVVLVEVAKRIQKIIQPGDFAARLSGDEFVIIHKNTSEDGTRKLIHDLIAISHSTYTIERQEISLSMSIGSAKWPQDGKTLREVMSRADLAMYEAKSTGRDYFRYTEQVGSRFYRDLTLSRKIASALDEQKCTFCINLSLI